MSHHKKNILKLTEALEPKTEIKETKVKKDEGNSRNIKQSRNKR